MISPYTGECQGGSVRCVVTMQARHLVACHGKECQRQSGSAFRMSMPVRKDSIAMANLTKQFRRMAHSGNEVGCVWPQFGIRIYHARMVGAGRTRRQARTLHDTSRLQPSSFFCCRVRRVGFFFPAASKRLRDRLREMRLCPRGISLLKSRSLILRPMRLTARKSRRSLLTHRGRILVRGGDPQPFDGVMPHRRRVIVEFDSPEAVRRFITPTHTRRCCRSG